MSKRNNNTLNTGELDFGAALAEVIERLRNVDIANFSGDEIPEGVAFNVVGPAGKAVLSLRVLCLSLCREVKELEAEVHRRDQAQEFQAAKLRLLFMAARWLLNLESCMRYPKLMEKQTFAINDDCEIGWFDLPCEERVDDRPRLVRLGESFFPLVVYPGDIVRMGAIVAQLYSPPFVRHP